MLAPYIGMKIFQYLTKMLVIKEAKKKHENAENARKAAEKLFPGEKWKEVENGIYLSPRRAIGKKSNYVNELRDAQILRDFGCTVYLVPENTRNKDTQFDAIVNGMKVEFKNQNGKSELTLKDHFLKSREQAPNVFINLEKSLLSKHKIMSVLYAARTSLDYYKKNKYPEGGFIFIKIRGHEKLYYLNINEMLKKQGALRALYAGQAVSF